MVKRVIREEARTLRQQGVSIGEIVTLLKVSKSSVSLWVRDVELTAAQIELLQNNRRNNKGRMKGAQVNREKFKALRLGYQETGRAKAKEGRPLHLAGCMLYWAEGAKSPNNVFFVNSDANMMLLFMRFLREELLIREELLSIRIHCHTRDMDEQERIERYWLALLRLAETSLRKTMFKQGSETSKKILENGICTVRVHRVEYVQHIYGAIQEYGGFDHPTWLF